jgi:hypothetical protein
MQRTMQALQALSSRRLLHQQRRVAPEKFSTMIGHTDEGLVDAFNKT